MRERHGDNEPPMRARITNRESFNDLQIACKDQAIRAWEIRETQDFSFTDALSRLRRKWKSPTTWKDYRLVVRATWKGRLGTTRVSSDVWWPSRSDKADRTGSRRFNGYQTENRPQTNACRDLAAALYLEGRAKRVLFRDAKEKAWGRIC